MVLDKIHQIANITSNYEIQAIQSVDKAKKIGLLLVFNKILFFI